MPYRTLSWAHGGSRATEARGGKGRRAGHNLLVTTNRWMKGNAPRGELYDRRFDQLAASGADMHGEATFVESYGPGSVLDAGCGTGRVAIELSRRGYEVVGIDMDPAMLQAARQKAPHLPWITADLADPDLADPDHGIGRRFDIIVMAGNVLIFVAPGTEGKVLANMAAHLTPGGILVSGYSLTPGGLSVRAHDELAARCGLFLEDRWSTWDRRPFDQMSTYAVSVHRCGT
jgi:SAM-dependent methyltransferase